MCRVLLIGLWVYRDPAGDVPPRFHHLPKLFAAHGLELVTTHRTELAVDPWLAEPPVGMILSGSRHNLGEDCTLADFPEVNALLAGLPQVPVLGICFGHQFLALANGGRLGRFGRDRVDNDHPVTPLMPHPLFADLPRPVPLAENHGMRVADPGPDFTVVAESDDGIEAIAHRSLPRLGVQFHPEYYPRQQAPEMGKQVLENWIGLIR